MKTQSLSNANPIESKGWSQEWRNLSQKCPLSLNIEIWREKEGKCKQFSRGRKKREMLSQSSNFKRRAGEGWGGELAEDLEKQEVWSWEPKEVEKVGLMGKTLFHLLFGQLIQLGPYAVYLHCSQN